MPPKRKALADTSTNAPVGRTNSGKKAKSSDDGNSSTSPVTTDLDKAAEAKIKSRAKRWSKVSGSKNLDADHIKFTKDPAHAFEFVCICKRDSDDDEDDEWDDEDEDEEEQEEEQSDKDADAPSTPKCDGGKTCPCDKTAADVPEHPYTLTRAGYSRASNANSMADYRNPDLFSMYTYNDHSAYGAMEVLENMLIDFKEARDNDDRLDAWSVAEGVALYMTWGKGDTMSMADDGERVSDLTSLVTRMALTALADLVRAGPDAIGLGAGQVNNAGWIIALYAGYFSDACGMDLIDPPDYDADMTPATAKNAHKKYAPENFGRFLRSYAKRLGVEVPDKAARTDSEDKHPELPLPADDAKDPWAWDKTFKAAKLRGGDRLDITTFTPAERKSANFDKKDPIPAKVMAEIKKGGSVVLS